MRHSTHTRQVPLAVALVAVFAATAASGDVIRYGWPGRVEPEGGENPWGLSGDGSALTPDDGTLFVFEVFVDEDAAESEAEDPDSATFEVFEATLLIDGLKASLLFAELDSDDDVFEGLFDNVSFRSGAELFDTTLIFETAVRLDAATFELSDVPAPDPPPVFAGAIQVQTAG